MHNDPKKEIAVLLVDDDEDDYLIVKHAISQIPDSPFRLDWCSSYEEAKQCIAEGVYDIYLIDYHLGEFNGLDLLRFAQPDKRHEPFVLLTGMRDYEVERRALKLAAADYLVKGTFGPELLSRTLYYSLGRKEVEQQRLEHIMELGRTKDEFISLASHQLRTPATGVKQYIGMILEGFVGDITPGQRDILTKAYESNERQLRIVSDLLKVARVDAGKVQLKKSDVDVSALVRDVIKEQQSTYKARHQTVKLKIPRKRIMAWIDKDRIRMVVENLCDNASKYSGDSKPITVTVDDDGNRVTVSVKDEGVGIAEKDQSKLFAKFSRIHNSLSTQVGGTGLGLYWANKIVDLHGGVIEVESKQDHGSTFTIRLPKKDQPAMLKVSEDYDGAAKP